jgi:3'-phosphoadenosine 5'-phosphosulfate sulfotransferase (PAPS reductase)/FAD synthetase
MTTAKTNKCPAVLYVLELLIEAFYDNNIYFIHRDTFSQNLVKVKFRKLWVTSLVDASLGENVDTV